jgi:hypothetical protein
VGSLTSHNPIGLQGLLRDSFTLLFLLANILDNQLTIKTPTFETNISACFYFMTFLTT